MSETTATSEIRQGYTHNLIKTICIYQEVLVQVAGS